MNYANHSSEEEGIDDDVEDNVTNEEYDETKEEDDEFTNGYVYSEDEPIVDEAVDE